MSEKMGENTESLNDEFSTGSEWLLLLVVAVIFIWWFFCKAKVPKDIQSRSVRNTQSEDRWMLAITVGLVGVVFNSPLSYALTSKLTCGFTANENACPTPMGLMIHNGLMVGLVRLLLW